MKTMDKTIEFNKLLPDFKRFVPAKWSKSRTVLWNVQHDGSYLNATDGHKLIRIKSEYVEINNRNPFLHLIHTDKFVDISNYNDYPDVSRLIPEEFNYEISLNSTELKAFKTYVNEISKVAKSNVNSLMTIKLTQTGVELSAINAGTGESIVRTIDYVNTVTNGNDLEIKVNSSYMKTALMAVSKLSKVNGNANVDFKFSSAFRPILITDNLAYDIIVSPIRSY